MKRAATCCIISIALFSSSMVLSSACTKKNTVMAPSTDTITKHDSLPYIPPADSTAKTYLALGDSYTIGQSVQPADRYPVQTVGLIKAEGINMANAEIIAATGWTTQNLWDAIKDKPLTPGYSVVSLLIGVNNQYQGRSLDEYRQQFTMLLQRSLQLARNNPSHVFVLSIPDYSVTPFGRNSGRPNIAAEIDMFNRVNLEISGQFHVNYINITDESRKALNDPSLIASDSLHFSGKEYRIWSGMLLPLMKPTLQ